MTGTFSIFNLFSLLGGLALFLYGMQQGELNIRRIGGNDLRRIITAMTRHRLFAYAAGFGATLITQSSSATTVILVGLASARVMTLGQSLGMILGSDLGTTITVQLFAFKFYAVAPLLIAGGYAIALNRKSDSAASAGRLIFAAGLIFYGMHVMADAVIPLRSMPFFERALYASLSNPWIGILAGAIFTATIHSSAATLTIVIALVQSLPGTPPPLSALFPIVMGANLGTCATAFIATFGAEIAGARVAWSHFSFKFFGTAVLIPLLPVIDRFAPLFPVSPVLQIALLHTFFNLCVSILFLPFLHPFEKLIGRLVQQRRKAAEPYQLEFLSDSVVNLPVLALAQAVKEIGRMAEKVRRMVEGSLDIIRAYSASQQRTIARDDDEVDFLHESIISYLTRMSREALDDESASYVYELIMITTDLEHIGDSVSKNVVHLAEKIDASPLPLSTEGREEIVSFFNRTIVDFSEVIAAFSINDTKLAKNVFDRKKEHDALYDQLFSRHMDRLFKRKPESLQTTSIHIDLLEEIRRIDHFVFRISGHILKIHHLE